MDVSMGWVERDGLVHTDSPTPVTSSILEAGAYVGEGEQRPYYVPICK